MRSFDPPLPADAAHSPSELSRPSLRNICRAFCLQASQRLGVVSFLCLLGTWGLLYVGKNPTLLLAFVAIAAETGLITALLARIKTSPPHRREANGIAIFNLTLLVLGLYLMLFLRLDQIHLAVAKFFSPPSSPPALTR